MTEITKRAVDPKIYEHEITELEKKLDTSEEQNIQLKDLLIRLIGEKYGIQIV